MSILSKSLTDTKIRIKEQLRVDRNDLSQMYRQSLGGL
jgi:hypothetical protein